MAGELARGTAFMRVGCRAGPVIGCIAVMTVKLVIAWVAGGWILLMVGLMVRVSPNYWIHGW